MVEVTKRSLGLTVDNFTWSMVIESEISDEQLNRLMPTISDIYADVISFFDTREDSTMEMILEAIQKELDQQLNIKVGNPELVLTVINLGPLDEDAGASV